MSGQRPLLRTPFELAVAASAAGFLLVITTRGVVVHADSVTYLDAAGQMAAGNGLIAYHNGAIRPLAHFPPLYPAALASFMAIGFAAESAARLLNVVCFSLTVALLAAVLRQLFGSMAVAALLVAIFACNPGVVLSHISVLSEPLFFLLGAATLVTALHYRRTQQIRWLWGAAMFAALTALTRYAGVVLTGFLIALVWLTATDGRERLRRSAAVATIGLLPIILWLARGRVTGDPAANRAVVLALPPVENWLEAISVLGSWIAPPAPALIKTILGVGVLFGAALFVLRGPARAQKLESWLCALLFLGYCAFLVFARITLDALIDFDARMLAPGLLFLLIAAAGEMSRPYNSRRAAAYAVGGVLLMMTVLGAVDAVAYTRAHVLGVRASTFDRSATAAVLRGLPAGVRVYSNRPYSLYYHFGTTARWLPCVVNNGGVGGIPDCEEGLEQLRSEFARHEAAVIWLHGGDGEDATVLVRVARHVNRGVVNAARGVRLLR